ncbi:MAG: hypothetical protein RL497_142 [Pseudomonadota bacterium]
MISHAKYGLVFLSLLVLAACNGSPQELVIEGFAPEQKNTCTAPANQQLSDIPSLVRWINTLPKPLSLSCFVASLPRPLYVYSAISGESAQTSLGDDKPRVFLFFGDLTLSVIPDEAYATHPSGEAIQNGDNKYNLLEISSNTQGIRSIKAEIKFPLAENLTPQAPYERINYGVSGTSCSLCHRYEQAIDEVNGVVRFASDRLKPTASVSLEPMRKSRKACSSIKDTYYCAMLAGLLDHGELIWQEFPSGLPDIYYRR